MIPAESQPVRASRALLAALLAAALQMAHPSTSFAKTIGVTTTDDELNADGDCSLREAVAAANVNVAVALALAGVGPDRTEVEIWADPAVSRNTHTIVVQSTVADLTMTIENVPSENPRTGRITALSVVSLLRKRGAALRVGS